MGGEEIFDACLDPVLYCHISELLVAYTTCTCGKGKIGTNEIEIGRTIESKRLSEEIVGELKERMI